MKLKKKIFNILFWSVVAAAFIGPGTVTTATKAGAMFGFDLMWALVFSTFACLLLQEASARITIISKMNLGQAIAKQFEGKSSRMLVLILIIGAIIIGCAAYETGNILGATSGISLIFKGVSPKILILGMSSLAFLALSLPSVRAIANFMGVLVLLMGIAFFTTAIQLEPSFTKMLEGAFVPKIPETGGAGLIILGLIGTTVVPYDIFLGSGVVEKHQQIEDMRFGLSVAIILGGIISMAILSVGTSIEGEFSFPALAKTLSGIGPWAVYVFGFGMFAAGFSSAITAPLASALTAKSLFEDKDNSENWKTNSIYFKSVWAVVLFTGLGFGLAGVKPIPAIILAQALNGFILPFISVFLLFVINDAKLMGKKNLNGWISNILMTFVVWITLLLGFINIYKAIGRTFAFELSDGIYPFLIISMVAFVISTGLLIKVYLIRREQAKEVFIEKT